MAKKRGRQIIIKLNLTNRWLYTFILIGIMILLGIVVYAFANPATGVGHDLADIGLPICAEGQVLGMVAGVWTCVDIIDVACAEGQILQMSGGAWTCVNGNISITSVDGLAGGAITSDVTVIGSMTLDTDSADGPQLQLYDQTSTPWGIDNNNAKLRFFRPGSTKLTLYDNGALQFSKVSSLPPCTNSYPQNEGMLIYYSGSGTFLACLKYGGSLTWYDLR